MEYQRVQYMQAGNWKHVRRLRSSAMWRRVVWYEDDEIWEEPAASIFQPEEYAEWTNKVNCERSIWPFIGPMCGNGNTGPQKLHIYNPLPYSVHLFQFSYTTYWWTSGSHLDGCVWLTDYSSHITVPHIQKVQIYNTTILDTQVFIIFKHNRRVLPWTAKVD
jgi:hypothetical protein